MGELNRLIDSLMHPHFRKHPALIILDGLLHAVVEKDADVSLRKFIMYNTFILLRHLNEKKKVRRPLGHHS